ncbi:MAG TPA: hypothetical protein VGH82_07000 [Gaiellaceae bacterium]
MGRRMCVTVAVIATVSAAAFGTTTVAGAARTAAICKTFSASGLKIEWSAIGTMTCSKAKPYLVKFLAHRGKPDVKAVLTGGPRGFKCSATDDAKGRPAVGACYTGTLAFPKNGFQWLG